MSKKYHYYVEGECEQTLINLLKVGANGSLISGKVDVLNFVQNKITDNRLMALDKNATIILVYDIDVSETSILEYNLKKLNKYGYKRIIHLQSIKNFEEEIVYCTSVKNINEIFGTNSPSEFKKHFIEHKNLRKKLEEIGFDVSKLWSRKNNLLPFSKYSNPDLSKTVKIN